MPADQEEMNFALEQKRRFARRETGGIRAGADHRGRRQARQHQGPGGGRSHAAPYRTIERRLPEYAQEAWRQRLSRACAAHARLARPASSSTTSARSISRPIRVTGFASPGFSRERRLEPQLTIGLLTARTGSRSWSAPSRGQDRDQAMLPIIETFGQSQSSLSADEFPAPRMSSSAMTGGHDGHG